MTGVQGTGYVEQRKTTIIKDRLMSCREREKYLYFDLVIVISQFLLSLIYQISKNIDIRLPENNSAPVRALYFAGNPSPMAVKFDSSSFSHMQRMF